MICLPSGTAGSRCSETVVRNLLSGDFFPRQLSLKEQTDNSISQLPGHLSRRRSHVPNVPMEAVGWDPLATPEAVSLTLGMDHSYWPEVGHMPTLSQSVWPWG